MNHRALLYRFWLALVVMLFLAALTGAAFAEPAAAAPPAAALDPMTQLVMLLIALAGAVLTPILTVIGIRVAAWIKAHTGVNVDKSIATGVDLAIGYAEQLASKHAASLGAKMPGADKMRIALPWFLQYADDKKLPAWVKAKAEELLEARLGLRPRWAELATTTVADETKK